MMHTTLYCTVGRNKNKKVEILNEHSNEKQEKTHNFNNYFLNILVEHITELFMLSGLYST